MFSWLVRPNRETSFLSHTIPKNSIVYRTYRWKTGSIRPSLFRFSGRRFSVSEKSYSRLILSVTAFQLRQVVESLFPPALLDPLSIPALLCQLIHNLLIGEVDVHSYGTNPQFSANLLHGRLRGHPSFRAAVYIRPIALLRSVDQHPPLIRIF